MTVRDFFLPPVPGHGGIVGSTESVLLAMFGPQQHDAHVQTMRFVVATCGSLTLASESSDALAYSRAAARERHMQTPEGRAWIAQTDREHAEWRANRYGL